jgi:hypothetical protein
MYNNESRLKLRIGERIYENRMMVGAWNIVCDRWNSLNNRKDECDLSLEYLNFQETNFGQTVQRKWKMSF